MMPMAETRPSAGTGSFETDGGIERRYAFRTDFLLRRGTVLHGPVALNGDGVLIDQSQREPRAGKVYAVGVEDVACLKRENDVPSKVIL